jgi:hypothetical protein
MITLEPKDRIYYYCKLNTAIEFILPKKQLLLSPLVSTNDPRENKKFDFQHFWDSNIHKNFKMEEVNVEISDLIRDDAKIVYFSKDSEYFGYEYSRMWAYYGDNHKGICIGLDKRKFIEENQNYIKQNLFRDIHYYEFDKSKFHEHIMQCRLVKETQKIY